jgi:hypothetical protein
MLLLLASSYTTCRPRILVLGTLVGQNRHDVRRKTAPTYLPLPSSVAVDHARLGRVVTEIYAPDYAFSHRLPVRIPNLQGHATTPLVQREARGFFKDEKYGSIPGQLGDLLHIDFSRERVDDIRVCAIARRTPKRAPLHVTPP